MRAIKFRARDIKTGEWIYGDLLHSIFSISLNDEVSEKRLFIVQNNVKYEVDPKTVGQYTGLKDENGKEIYEDNIIEFEEPHFESGIEKARVVFREGSFVAISLTKVESTTEWNYNNYPIYYMNEVIDRKNFRDCEVIGNIYEDKEKLK